MGPMGRVQSPESFRSSGAGSECGSDAFLIGNPQQGRRAPITRSASTRGSPKPLNPQEDNPKP